MRSAPTVVVGAGPAGLAAAAMLRRAGAQPIVLERERLGASWRRHYRCLRLHTVRSLSSLPGADLPRSCGRWVAGADFLAYLERYAERERLDIRPGVEARRVDTDGDGFVITTATRPIAASAVVIATGYNHEPALPDWTRPDGAALAVVHSSGYRDAAPYRGQAVLVVGAGNSGSDIVLDLAAGGAREVWLSARSAPGVVPRQVLGLPAQVAAIPLSRAPTPLADAVARLERRLFLGDLTGRGLPAQGEGVFTRHARRSVLPILDHGFARAVKAGRVAVVPAVEAIEADEVVLEGGRRLRPDSVVAATGYRPALVPLVGHLGVLGPDGLPLHQGGAVHPAVPGLHFAGFRNPITGALRELRFEAAAIASAIV
ncbi:MAG TPA: NAD(P)/FAD-dependent oxidoreductase [Gaiellales bacterium]|nr:NAD(P)/FAD-dependent oxidoreductase [Gaiellales bacterium]